jgi:hypothetical protein
MFKRNRYIGSFVLGFAITACQAPQKQQDEAIGGQETASESAQGDASEGVVGPDEAFFAARYLEQVFSYSRMQSNPSLDSASGLVVGPGSFSAFDYQANFTEFRLRLMTASLFTQGDLDQDGSLSQTEFLSLRMDPATLGAPGEKLSHSFDRTFFERAAGADELFQIDECVTVLQGLGSLVKAELDEIPLQDHRRQLLQAWEKVLGRYDMDQNGSLSLQEQRDLRKDRALLISRLTGE